MISKKTKYAFHALIYLAKEYNKGPVLISEIAQKERIPKKFLESILLNLKNNRILTSQRGKGGGYLLAKEPNRIILGDIMRILEGPLAPVSCVSQTAYHRCSECKDEDSCGLRIVMKQVRNAMSNILDKTSLSDVLDLIKYEKDKNVFDFVI